MRGGCGLLSDGRCCSDKIGKGSLLSNGRGCSNKVGKAGGVGGGGQGRGMLSGRHGCWILSEKVGNCVSKVGMGGKECGQDDL